MRYRGSDNLMSGAGPHRDRGASPRSLTRRRRSSCGSSSIRRATSGTRTGTDSRRSCIPIRGVVSVETRGGHMGGRTSSRPWRSRPGATTASSAHGNASLRSVFVDPDAHPQLVTDWSRASRVSELAARADPRGGPSLHGLRRARMRSRLAVVVVDRSELLPMMPTADTSGVACLGSRTPRSFADRGCARRRPRRMQRSLEEWARRLGFSPRHLRPPLQAGHGCDVLDMAVVARTCSHSLVLLASGTPVTRVATDLGYSSTSAFIEMFKRTTGRTPGTYGRG